MRPGPGVLSGMNPWLLVFAATIALSGCLPFSCTRTESRAVSAADSLSRQIASRVLADTLQRMGTLTGFGDVALEYPRTVLFGSDGRLYVADAERGSIFALAASASDSREITWDDLQVPYLAGQRGDTIIVYSPSNGRFTFLVDNAPSHSVHVPDDIPRQALQYTAVGEANLYLKVVTRDEQGYLARIGPGGRELSRRLLKGSQWRHAGLLRMWQGDLVSLSGFYPIVDLYPPSLAGDYDSLALTGFDSPMLHRTRAFDAGRARGAPLVAGSAAALDSALYVLNMRPGWLRIDVYDKAGMLRHILLDGEPVLQKSFYPIDIAIRSSVDGIEIAVAVLEPTPEVRLYVWREGNCCEI